MQFAEGAFTRGKKALIRTCGERAAEDYTKAAQELGWCWQAIAAAEHLAGGRGASIAPDTVWRKLSVPGGEYLTALKKASHTEWGAPVILSGETLGQRTGIAADLVEAHVKELVGNL